MGGLSEPCRGTVGLSGEVLGNRHGDRSKLCVCLEDGGEGSAMLGPGLEETTHHREGPLPLRRNTGGTKGHPVGMGMKAVMPGVSRLLGQQEGPETSQTACRHTQKTSCERDFVTSSQSSIVTMTPASWIHVNTAAGRT
ncbi:unnamed protein product [Arctogadus glacialis]